MLKLERKEKGTMLFKDIVDAKRCAFFNDAVTQSAKAASHLKKHAVQRRIMKNVSFNA